MSGLQISACLPCGRHQGHTETRKLGMRERERIIRKQDITCLIIQIEEERRICTIIYFATLVCFSMGDQFTSIFSKIIILIDRVLKLHITVFPSDADNQDEKIKLPLIP